MARRRGPRHLVVDQDRFLWSLAHAHQCERDDQGVPRYVDCREVVKIHRNGSRGRLEVLFQAGAGHLVPDGVLHAGGVRRPDGSSLNLNEPGVVRALLDEALARGWQAGAASRAEIDGWTLFDAVLARRVGGLRAEHPGLREGNG